MGKLTILEETFTPATPAAGVTLFTTAATPSLLKFINDNAEVYTIAGLEKAQSFTTAQTIAPTTSVDGLTINMPAGNTAEATAWKYNGTLRANMRIRANASFLNMISFDNGSAEGCEVYAGRNSNGSTPAPGVFSSVEADGTFCYLYADNSDVWRTLTTTVTNANFAGGTIVGTQTSMAEAKFISDDLSTLAEVMERIRTGAAAVRRFAYRNGRYGGETFEGVVTDYAPDYGMDKNEQHPQGQSLNEITIPGDLLRFASWAIEQIETLTRRVSELEAR